MTDANKLHRTAIWRSIRISAWLQVPIDTVITITAFPQEPLSIYPSIHLSIRPPSIFQQQIISFFSPFLICLSAPMHSLPIFLILLENFWAVEKFLEASEGAKKSD